MKKFFSYLKEIGKELKKFASNNVKETIGLGIILAMFVLLFIIPKIILGLICVSLILGLGVVSLSSLLEDMQEGERIGFK